MDNKREMTLEEVRKLWLEKEFGSGESFNLYIDNPFCIRKCKFCIHFGSAERIGSDVYNRYYCEYLPHMIDLFRDILEKRPVDTVYFGGGTASLMTAKIMRDIFDCIPNFLLARERAFEAHPAFLTEEKVKIFGEYRFNYISLGIQSMQPHVIEKNDRIPPRDKQLPELIEMMKLQGSIVNCDLMTTIDRGTVEDTETLFRDLCMLAERYRPQSITVYPMHQRYYLSFDKRNLSRLTKEQIEHDCALKRSINRAILKFLFRHKEYHLFNDIFEHMEDEKLIEHVHGDTYLITVPNQEFAKVRLYNCSSYPGHPENQNVIGLGGYGQRAPYSYQGKAIYYHTVNDNWKPRFEVRHQE